ncbi:DASH complex subunit Dad4-domain-containing protein [Thelephora terrestris]|uniref:DASH complex subunit DAD4 n=1 Tax=Thelephora terrestris TaxID=56493 RepID=A0A9P6LC84_9AGAM|nr:DASH complex subunit Dad4-domain-containing protein [Thelephora terrestris]
MENPHNERQAILLQRIVKSVTKCNDIFQELNQCLEEIVQANEEIRLGADLASKYRKNAQFNIEALRASGALPPDPQSGDSHGGPTPTPDDPQP